MVPSGIGVFGTDGVAEVDVPILDVVGIVVVASVDNKEADGGTPEVTGGSSVGTSVMSFGVEVVVVVCKFVVIGTDCVS